jgi:hypothetical protein
LHYCGTYVVLIEEALSIWRDDPTVEQSLDTGTEVAVRRSTKRRLKKVSEVGLNHLSHLPQTLSHQLLSISELPPINVEHYLFIHFFLFISGNAKFVKIRLN